MQGISPIQPIFSKIRLENLCEFSSLRDNSLRIGAGNLFARAGNYFDLFGCSRDLREIDSRARVPNCVKMQSTAGVRLSAGPGTGTPPRATSSKIGGAEFSFWKTKSCYRASVSLQRSREVWPYAKGSSGPWRGKRFGKRSFG